MATVVLVGTLDTKEQEYRWLRGQLAEAGCDVTIVDAGTFSDAGAELADVGSRAVAEAAGTDLDALRAAGNRGAAMEAMATGAARVVRRLHDEGALHAVLAVGGSS